MAYSLGDVSELHDLSAYTSLVNVGVEFFALTDGIEPVLEVEGI